MFSTLLSAEDPQSSTPPSASPSVRFIHPVQGEVIGGPFHVVVETQHISPIRQVSLFRGADVLGIDMEPPFDILWDTRALAEGPQTLTAKAADANFHEARASVAVTIDNTPPTVSLIAPTTETTVVGSVTLSAKAEDARGLQYVRFLVDGQPVGDVRTPPYEVVWNTEQIPNMRYTVEARAVDLAGHGTTSVPMPIRVSNFNEEPVIDPIEPIRLAELAPWTFQVPAVDPNAPRDPLAFQIEGLPAWAAYDAATGVIQGTPPATETTVLSPTKVYPVHISVCDPEPLCAAADITVTVVDTNHAPVVQPIKNQRVAEGQKMEFSIIAADPDGDAIKCRSRQMPRWAKVHAEHCTVAGAPPMDIASLSERTVVYQGVELMACDPNKLCTSRVITVAVTDENREPVWEDLKPLVAEEGRRLTVNLTATDMDKDRIVVSAPSLPEGARFTDMSGGLGQLTWMPRIDQSGRHEAKIVVTDGLGFSAAVIPITVKERVAALAGAVLDKDDRPVRDVSIKVFYQQRTVAETTTDAAGVFLIPDIPSGEYVVKPDLHAEVGFTTRAREKQVAVFDPPQRQVEVTVGDTRGLDFKMGYE